MGYIGNFVAISAFLPLPFAGYYLAKEIYAFSQTLGLTMMGGAFSWLFIVQAVLIGNLFLAANYYLWLGMGRVEGVQPLQKFIKYLLVGITLCFAVWATPRSIIATVSELRAMGGGTHPILGYFGVMSAKNTAVNILILTAINIFLFRGARKTGEVHWGRMPAISQYVLIFIAVTFTWLMGLMGYIRSGLRQHWHVYGVMRDTSVDAFTPTIGFATQVVSVTVLLFFCLIGFVFWITSLHDRPDFERQTKARLRRGSGEVSPESPVATPGT